MANNKEVQLRFSIPAELNHLVRVKAVESGKTKNELLASIIADSFDYKAPTVTDETEEAPSCKPRLQFFGE